MLIDRLDLGFEVSQVIVSYIQLEMFSFPGIQ